MQDVFISVARGLASFHHEARREGAFRAWLWTITRHRIIDWFRAGKGRLATGGSSNARRVGEIAALGEEDPEPTSPLDLHWLVRRAMVQVEGTVASGTWRAFWRTVIEGQRTDSVAEELGMTAAAVRQSRSRVLRRLREQLGDC